MTAGRPDLRLERQLLRRGRDRVVGVDEVGRGAIAGPVAVGAAVIDRTTPTAPIGLRDSKLLSPAQRKALFPRLCRWVRAGAVGRATCDEIDEWGLTAALRLAALRALAQVGSVDVVILDGAHDWLTEPAPALFDLVEWPLVPVPPVHLVVKGDRRCSSVAAASVLAKVTRDREMARLAGSDDPYGWSVNKGYATREHAAAIRAQGLAEQHRHSWAIAAATQIDLTHKVLPSEVVPS